MTTETPITKHLGTCTCPVCRRDLWDAGIKGTGQRGGFEPIPLAERPCSHPEHHPPSHLHIPYGMQYRHFCPACGKESVMRAAQVTL